MRINLSEAYNDLFECIASETRLEILRMLSKRPMNISELAAKLYITPSVVTRHIARMEKVGLITSRVMAGKRGYMRVCAIREQQVIIDLLENESVDSNCITALPIGGYSFSEVKAPCGLMSEGRLLCLRNDPRYFHMPERQQADMLWMSSGHLDYILPQIYTGMHTGVEIQFWLQAKANALPTLGVDPDLFLTFFCNQTEICCVREKVSVPYMEQEGNYLNLISSSDIYGEKRCLRITKSGTWYGEERVSDFTFDKMESERFSISVAGDFRQSVLYLFGQSGVGFSFHWMENSC